MKTEWPNWVRSRCTFLGPAERQLEFSEGTRIELSGFSGAGVSQRKDLRHSAPPVREEQKVRKNTEWGHPVHVDDGIAP